MRSIKIVSALFLPLLTCGDALYAQEFRVLHNFDYPSSIAEPYSTLVETSPGVFVGSYVGGLFQIASTGTFSIFASFANSTYDVAGEGALTPASNGYLYGYRSNGYPSAIYRVTPSGARDTLVNSTLSSAGPLMEASDGELWGTQGPAAGPFSVFKISLDGKTLTTAANGLAGPVDGPILQASDGNFYVATNASPSGSSGQIYRVTPSGDLTSLYTFPDGEGSFGGLIEASNHVLYGTTPGEIFAISLSGSFKILYNFAICCDGYGPAAGLLEASDGNLYGTTDAGGELGYGSIFRIGLDGSGYTDLISFDLANAAYPVTEGPGLTQGSDGKLYGTAGSGGSENGGVVFKFNNFLAPPLPSVKFAQPQTAKPGATIRLTGNYLLGLSAVSFNGTPATFTAVNVNYAYAVVPAGATTGPITVTTPNGSYTTKSDFTVE